MDEAGGVCDRCGKPHGADPFLMRLESVWQRMTFCPTCIGRLVKDMIAYLNTRNRKRQPPLFR